MERERKKNKAENDQKSNSTIFQVWAAPESRTKYTTYDKLKIFEQKNRCPYGAPKMGQMNLTSKTSKMT